MKIGLVSSVVPLVFGGGRFIVEWLANHLKAAGQEVEIIYIPFSEEPEFILPQMMAFRLLALQDSCDRIITFRPPSHLVPHPNKIVWFIHHLRTFYDLWNSPYRGVPDTPYWVQFRKTLMAADTTALREARRVFTNSQIVARRLRHFNGIDGEVLYPPILAPEQFYFGGFGDEIVCICRMEHHKRQDLLIEAMARVRSPVRLRLCGRASDPAFLAQLEGAVARFDVAQRVVIDHRWISESEKADLLSTALACAYVPLDEDSYGYPTLEAAHACKPTVTVTDSGGVREFVIDEENGIVAEADPRAIAEAFDKLWSDRSLAARFGASAHERIRTLGIDWTRVVHRLLS